MSIKIFDTDSKNDLLLLHFEEHSEEVNSYRGLIVEDNFTDKNEVLENDLSKYSIVCSSFPFTPEYKLENSKEIFENFINNSRVYHSYEGTVLRLYNYKDLWFLSTHKKINALFSRWGSMKSFGQMFMDLLGIKDLQEINNFNLDKHKIYTFLVRTNADNRIVCKHEESKLFYLGSFDRNNNFKYSNDTFNNVDNVPEINIKTYEEAEHYMKNINFYKEQGIILISEKGETIKFLNSNYSELFNLRKNESNITKAYIMNIKDNTKREFLDLYNEHIESFRKFDLIISNIASNIHKNYISRYIKNNIAIIPPEQYSIMKSIYEQYLKRNKEYVYITKNLVMSHIFKQDTNNIFNLYFMYCNRENLYGNGNKVEEHIKNKIKI